MALKCPRAQRRILPYPVPSPPPQLIRAWDPLLSPIGQPLDSHASSVRVLAAGRTGLLVSGDAEGDVCIWEVCQVQLPGLNGRNGPNGLNGLNGPNGSGSPGGSMASLSSVEISMSDAVMMQLEEFFSPSKPAVQQQQEGVVVAEEQAAVMASAMAMGVAAGALAGEQVQVGEEECLDAGADVGYLEVQQQQEEEEQGQVHDCADGDAAEGQVCCGEADVGSDSEAAVGEVMMQHHHRWHGVQPEGEDPEPWVSSHPVDVQQEEEEEAEEEGLELEESLSQTVWNNLPSEGLGLEVPVSRNGVAFSQLQKQRHQQQQQVMAAAAVAGWAEVVDPGQGVFDEEPVAAALSELTSAAYNGAANDAHPDAEGAEFAAADSGQGFAVEWGAAEGQQRLQQLYASDFAASA